MSLDSIFQSKAVQKLQALGAWMQANKTLNAISSGMMAILSLLLAGAIFMILATILDLVGVIDATSPVYVWLVAPYNMTIGLLALAVSFCVGYSYTRNLDMKGELANGLVCMFLFIMVAAPVETLVLEGGATTSAIQTSFLGSSGLFPAMILPLLIVRIIKLCQDKHLTISMPDSVPQFLQDSFTALIPLVINIVLWCGLDTACKSAIGVGIPAAIIGLLSAPLGALTSIPGVLVLVILCTLFWSFGIHGAAITGIVVYPLLMAAMTHNAELVAAGMPPEFVPILLFGVVSCCGGAGNVVSLAVHCMRSKSEQLKAIGKAGIIPSLFNISEPMLFGVPIMYNPIIIIPFILNPIIIFFIVWAGYAFGFFQPGYILIMTQLPIFAAQFFASMAWQNLLIAPIGFIVSFLVYAPFVKMYDKQLLEQEAAAASSEE